MVDLNFPSNITSTAFARGRTTLTYSTAGPQKVQNSVCFTRTLHLGKHTRLALTTLVKHVGVVCGNAIGGGLRRPSFRMREKLSCVAQSRSRKTRHVDRDFVLSSRGSELIAQRALVAIIYTSTQKKQYFPNILVFRNLYS